MKKINKIIFSILKKKQELSDDNSSEWPEDICTKLPPETKITGPLDLQHLIVKDVDPKFLFNWVDAPKVHTGGIMSKIKRLFIKR